MRIGRWRCCRDLGHLNRKLHATDSKHLTVDLPGDCKGSLIFLATLMHSFWAKTC